MQAADNRVAVEAAGSLAAVAAGSTVVAGKPVIADRDKVGYTLMVVESVADSAMNWDKRSLKSDLAAAFASKHTWRQRTMESDMAAFGNANRIDCWSLVEAK